MFYITFRNVKPVFVLLLWIGLLSLTQACKHADEAGPQPVDPGFGPNGEPRILLVKIPGIPDQNIVINQDTKQIVVTVPTSYSAETIQPVLTMTPSTTTLSGLPYVIHANEDASQYPISIRTPGNKITTYSVVLNPAGELTFGALSGPQNYSLGERIVYAELPVYNYVDGAGFRNSKVTLINQTSGERLVPSIVLTGRNGVVDQNLRTDGAMILTVYLDGGEFYYAPGSYTVELVKPNGRKATLNQPIQLIKGATKAVFNVETPLLLNSGDYLLYGWDFYRTDKVSVRIQGPNQQEVLVDALGFIDPRTGIYRTGVRLPTALNLKPGYYYAQLLINGVATSSTGRITISDQPKPLIIDGLYLPGQSPRTNLIGNFSSFDTPIVLTKGISYEIETNYYAQFAPTDLTVTRRVRLTRLTDRTQVYDVPFGQGTSVSADVLKLPTTLPDGRYELKVHVVRGDGTIIDGIPLERDIVVQ